MLLLADQARAGKAWASAFPTRSRLLMLLPHPRPTPPTARCLQESKGPPGFPALRLAEFGPLAFGVQPARAPVILSPGHCSHRVNQPGSASSSALPSDPTGPRAPLPPSSTPLPCSLSFLSLLFLPSGPH